MTESKPKDPEKVDSDMLGTQQEAEQREGGGGDRVGEGGFQGRGLHHQALVRCLTAVEDAALTAFLRQSTHCNPIIAEAGRANLARLGQKLRQEQERGQQAVPMDEELKDPPQ